MTGCGGSSSSDNSAQSEPSENTESQDVTPPDDEEIDEAYYEPYPLTHEQLVELADNIVPKESFDLYWKYPTYNDYDFEDAEDDDGTAERKELVNAMWRHAVELVVEPNIPQATHHNGLYGVDEINQVRYLYVYAEYGGGLETFPQRQWYDPNDTKRNHIVGSGYCEHPIYGTDCVGFVYQCAYYATSFDERPLKMRKGALLLTSPDIWTRETKSNGEPWFPNAKSCNDEIGSTPPKPGDILSWKLGSGSHVGIAVRIDENTIGVAHSVGKTNPPYTCREYKDAGEQSIETPTTRGNKECNGFVINTYDFACSFYGREANRLRLEETEPEDEHANEHLIGKLAGVWKPVNAKCDNTLYNDYGQVVRTSYDHFIKYDPAANHETSSFLVNVEFLREENGGYVVSDDGQIVVAKMDRMNTWTTTSTYKKIFQYPLKISGDKLSTGPKGLYNNSTIEEITVEFPSYSTMRVIDTIRERNSKTNTIAVFDFKRATGNETPEPDLMLEKISGTWEPVDYVYKRKDDNTYRQTTEYTELNFVPHHAESNDYYSSSTEINLTVEKAYGYYRIKNDGKITATNARGVLVNKRNIFGDEYFPKQYSLAASGDVLFFEVGEFDMGIFSWYKTTNYMKFKAEFLDDDTLKITNGFKKRYLEAQRYNAYDLFSTVSEDITLRRKR